MSFSLCFILPKCIPVFRPAAIKQEEATAKLLSALDVDEADLKVEIDDDTPFIKDDVEDENEVKEHGKWMNRVDVLIRRIFALSADYAVIDGMSTFTIPL